MYKILVPIDGSEYSVRAMLKAKELAKALESDITLINVINPLQDLKYMHNKEFYTTLKNTAVKESNEILHKALESFKDFPYKVNAFQKLGDTVEEIIKFAEEGEYNLVVMGRRGAGKFSRTLLGGVSDKVVHHINTSVLIVK